MRRLARHLFTFCSALSLLLCMAVCVLWVRSYWITSAAIWRDAELVKERRIVLNYREISSAYGRLAMNHTEMSWEASSEIEAGRYVAKVKQQYRAMPRLSKVSPATFNFKTGGFNVQDLKIFQYGTLPDEHPAEGWGLVLPCWLLALLTAIFPAVWLCWGYQGGIARQRLDIGLCPNCGYDLRASPKRCPECGAEKSAKN
jgi:hypothetical protein